MWHLLLPRRRGGSCSATSDQRRRPPRPPLRRAAQSSHSLCWAHCSPCCTSWEPCRGLRSSLPCSMHRRPLQPSRQRTNRDTGRRQMAHPQWCPTSALLPSPCCPQPKALHRKLQSRQQQAWLRCWRKYSCCSACTLNKLIPSPSCPRQRSCNRRPPPHATRSRRAGAAAALVRGPAAAARRRRASAPAMAHRVKRQQRAWKGPGHCGAPAAAGGPAALLALRQPTAALRSLPRQVAPLSPRVMPSQSAAAAGQAPATLSWVAREDCPSPPLPSRPPLTPAAVLCASWLPSPLPPQQQRLLLPQQATTRLTTPGQ